MNDDVRHPRVEENSEDKNKKLTSDTDAQESTTPASESSVPPLLSQEEGFAAAKANGSRTIKQRHLRFVVAFRHATKKQQIIGGAVIAVLLIAGSGGIYALHKSLSKGPPNVAAPVVERAAEPPKPTTEASRLTGEQIDPALNKRPITGIMIENSPDARPQSGMNQAGVIYEAIAEGGITRFLCLFQQTQPDYIGPVRSVRPYYVDYLLPYDASIVHAGGSAGGLAKVRDMGVKDLDHGANGGAFQRVSDRFAPHNLYTSMAKLDEVSAARGYVTSDVKSLARKEEKPGQPITAKAINISMSSPLYDVHYDYDPVTNNYLRTLGGRPHTDQRSGQQLSPKVVIALAASYSQSGIYSVYQTNGTGRAYIFQDGTAQQVSWTKASERDQIVFTDDAGKPVALNAGQTWFTVVKDPNAVTFIP